MERFRFPLAKLLRVRTHKERAARRDMAEALAELQRLELKVQSAERDLAACVDEAAGNSSGAGLAHAMQKGLEGLLRRLRRDRDAADGVAAKAREFYRERRSELRSIERLRERRLEEWREQLLKSEQKQMDEVARLRSVRVRHRGGPRSRMGETRS